MLGGQGWVCLFVGRGVFVMMSGLLLCLLGGGGKVCLSWRLIRLVGDWLRGGSSSSMIALFQRFAAYKRSVYPLNCLS